MRTIALLMMLAATTGLAAVAAIGVALSMAASDRAGMVTILWIAAVVCTAVAVSSTIGVRILNRRNGTAYTLFTI